MRKTVDEKIYDHCKLRLISRHPGKSYFELDAVNGSMAQVSLVDREKVAHEIASFLQRPHEEIYQAIWSTVD